MREAFLLVPGGPQLLRSQWLAGFGFLLSVPLLYLVCFPLGLFFHTLSFAHQ